MIRAVALSALWVLTLVLIREGVPARWFDPFGVNYVSEVIFRSCFSVAVAVTLLLCYVFLGALVLGHRGFLTKLTLTERVCASIPVGMFVLSALYLALGLVSAISPVTVLLGVVGALSAGRWIPKEFWRRSHEEREIRDEGAFRLLIIANPIICFFFLKALVPVTEWGSLAYHFQLPERILNRGDVWSWEGFPMWNFPASAILTSLPFHALTAVQAVHLQVYLLMLVAITLTFHAARHMAGARCGAFAVVLMIGNSVLWLVACSSLAEPYLCLCAAAACFFVARSSQRDPTLDRELNRGLWLTLGFGVASKVLFLPLAFGFGVWTVVQRAVPPGGGGRWIRDLLDLRRPPVRAGIALLVISMAPAIFWYGRNIAVFGSPFYPTRLAPTYVSEGRRLPVYERVDPILQSWRQQLTQLSPRARRMYQYIASGALEPRWGGTMKGRPLDLITDPETFTRGAREHLNQLLLFGPFFVAIWPGLPRLFGILGLISLATVIAGNGLLWRYLVPTLPLLSLAGAWLLEKLARLGTGVWHRVSVIIAYGYCTVLIASLCLSTLSDEQLMSEIQYITGSLRPSNTRVFNTEGQRGYFKMRDKLLEVAEKKPEGKVLFLGDMRTMYLPLSVIPDLEMHDRVPQNWLRLLAECADYDDIAAALHHHRVTHVMVRNQMLFRGLSCEEVNHERLERSAINLLWFLDRYATVVELNRGFGIYELTPRADLRNRTPQCGGYLADGHTPSNSGY